TVHRKDDAELLDRTVVNDLIERPLAECRVDRANRSKALRRHASRECHGVLLSNPDIEESVGHLFLQNIETGAIRHRRRDTDDLRIIAAYLHHRIAEYFCVLGWLRSKHWLRDRHAGDLIERAACRMIPLHVRLGGLVSLP